MTKTILLIWLVLIAGCQYSKPKSTNSPQDLDSAAQLVPTDTVITLEASTIFDDAPARIFDDVEHSTDEVREIIIGTSILDRLLVVSFTEVSEEDIRIMSARLATRKERKDYEENVRA
jgi:uncharacterized protein